MEDILEKSFVVYLLTNKTNSRCYVDKTIQQLKFRIKVHKCNKKSLIGRAIQAHGWQNFKVEILEECATEAELNEREIYWIKTLNTKVPNGYNLTDGGEGTSGIEVSEKTRMSMSNSSPNKRAVRCLTTGEIFDSISAAATKYSIDPSGISKVCHGQAIKIKGFLKFEFLDAPLSEEAKSRKSNHRTEKVICENTGEVFESIKAAAQHFGISRKVISDVCRAECNITHGLKFCYVNEEKRAAAEMRRNEKCQHRNKNALICEETGIIYESPSAASKETGINRKYLCSALNGHCKTAGNLHWNYLDEEKRAAAEIRRNKRPTQRKRVICIETAVIYCSIKDASEKTGICRSSIVRVCRHLRNTAGGYHWKYANQQD